ncbi:hypothetical protein CH063_10444 [Colletotrichum higginsianum]|uniref:Uncharacterized protein n=1 Tax=Colletotrichum higginsianum (strain IMI 349063) TaxID=759273 RepID=H1VHH2_COLHI|nr:hypothetical protein CH063_10444 [Colletotrichum higginsianum]
MGAKNKTKPHSSYAHSDGPPSIMHVQTALCTSPPTDCTMTIYDAALQSKRGKGFNWEQRT